MLKVRRVRKSEISQSQFSALEEEDTFDTFSAMPLKQHNCQRESKNPVAAILQGDTWGLTDDTAAALSAEQVIWVQTIEDLKNELERRNPAPAGFTRISKFWNSQIEVLPHLRPNQGTSLERIFEVVKQGSKVELNRNFRCDLPKCACCKKDIYDVNNKYNVHVFKGDLVYDYEYLEYNPSRAKSIMTRRKNSKKTKHKKGEVPVDALRIMREHLGQSLIENLPSSFKTYNPAHTDSRDSIMEEIPAMAEVLKKLKIDYRHFRWVHQIIKDELKGFIPGLKGHEDPIRQEFGRFLERERRACLKLKREHNEEEGSGEG